MAANVGKAIVNVEVHGPAVRDRALELAVKIAESAAAAGARVAANDVVATAQAFEAYLSGPVTK